MGGSGSRGCPGGNGLWDNLVPADPTEPPSVTSLSSTVKSMTAVAVRLGPLEEVAEDEGSPEDEGAEDEGSPASPGDSSSPAPPRETATPPTPGETATPPTPKQKYYVTHQ